jgi:uncharacterized protein YutE (UPF0331/DUF86 family)
MNINFGRIREKFLQSKKYWIKLNTIIAKSPEEVEKDLDLQLISERIFEILSQIVLDICTHIISQSEESAPQNYSDCIKKLGKIGIIEQETSVKLISLIKMRNIVVHQYGDIDYNLLLQGLKDLHHDYIQFENEILSWINTIEDN